MHPVQFVPGRLREARGIRRREEIAVAARVSVETLRRWESGAYVPNASQLAAIASATGKSIAFFFQRAA